MVQQVTSGIKISVATEFEGAFYKDYKITYAFGYTITIENKGKDTVQLNSRHWDIFDALNNKEIVEGEGVIGQQPLLAPQGSHSYSSGCLLNAPFGTMSGYYNMFNFSTGKTIKVYIPAFSLNAPFALN